MIYFIQATDGGPIKIGTTKRLSVRLKALSARHSCKLAVLGVMDGTHGVEANLHRGFASTRLGGEWFNASEQLLAFIGEHARPWDGVDEVPLPNVTSVKLPDEMMRMAKVIAISRGVPVAEYLSEVLEPIVYDHFHQEYAKRLSA